MAEYINKKTGAHLLTDDVVSGGDWEPVQNFSSDDDSTIQELKAKLDALNIKYGSKAKKTELLELLEAAEENQEAE